MEEFVMVVVVVFILIGNLREKIIKKIEVKVQMIGNLEVIMVIGFQEKKIQILEMIMEIGIVVDEEIVVVENVESVMEEKGMKKKEEEKKEMKEINEKIIEIKIVMMQVLVKVELIKGIKGEIYEKLEMKVQVEMII